MLGFKETYIAKTVAAQVIGSSGSEQSLVDQIDKGTSAGVDKDMAVITADGLVGRVLRAFGSSSAQVLLINDQSSGVGVILDKSRLQGVIKGTASGEVILEKVMTDEQVTPGDKIVTSGGDQIFPKGLTVGSVIKVSPGADLFLNIRVKPSANLSRLEEVLVITKKEDRAPSLAETNSVRAVDILTQRLPSVPDKPAVDPNQPPAAATPDILAKPPATAPRSQSPSVAGSPAANSGVTGTVKPVTAPKPAPPAGQATPPAPKPVTTAPAAAQPETSKSGTAKSGASQTSPPQASPTSFAFATTTFRVNPDSVPITYTSQRSRLRFTGSVCRRPLSFRWLRYFCRRSAPRFHFFSLFDLPLLVVIFFAVARRSQVAGLVTGSVIGLLQDALTHQHIGIAGIAEYGEVFCFRRWAQSSTSRMSEHAFW